MFNIYKKSIVDGLKEFYDYWDNILSDLKKWKQEGNKIIAFGSSIMAQKCIKYLMELGIDINDICDNDENKLGWFFVDKNKKIEVISTSDALKKGKAYFIICTGLQHLPTIKKQLNNYNIETILSEPYLDYQLELFILLKQWNETEWKNKIYEMFDYYEEDRMTYEIIWNHFNCVLKMNDDFMEIPRFDKLRVEPQYFIDDGKWLGKQNIMVDCGAFIGDTLEELLFKIKYTDFDYYDCFEMDEGNFLQLENAINKLEEDSIKKRIRINNNGVGKENYKYTYRSSGGGRSIISDSGNSMAVIRKLDDIYKNDNISFLKMDIEGSEQNALIGAKKVISRCKPFCAVCIYHDFFAFWDVPRLLRSYVPEYKMILRHHSNNWQESVCYAKIGGWT